MQGNHCRTNCHGREEGEETSTLKDKLLSLRWKSKLDLRKAQRLSEHAQQGRGRHKSVVCKPVPRPPPRTAPDSIFGLLELVGKLKRNMGRAEQQGL